MFPDNPVSSPSFKNKLNQPKALLLRPLCDLKANCEFINLFYLFFYKTIWHPSENSLLSGGVCRFESAEGLGCRSCLWIAVVSCEVLGVGSAGSLLLWYIPGCAWERAPFRKPALCRGWRGGWRRGKVCWKPTQSSGPLAGYEGGWQSLWGGVLRTSLQTGPCRQLGVRPSRHTNPSRQQPSARVLWCGVWRLHLRWLHSSFTEEERLKTSGYCWVVAISTWRRVAAREQHAFVLFCFFFFFWWKFY